MLESTTYMKTQLNCKNSFNKFRN